MKYYEINLRKIIETEFNWALFKFVFSDMISTLSIFKHKGVFCSKLKPENIFIEEDYNNK